MEIEQRIIDIVADVLDLDSADIKPESHLISDLAADSIDIMDIVMHIESEFSITIPDDEADRYLNYGGGSCVQDLINLTNHTLNK